ncbi:MAG: PEP-CTERM sorting domain-containing protein [Phycisphaerales bacterium]
MMTKTMILTVAAAGAAASGQVISFGYTDLNASYDATAGLFTAVADTSGNFSTAGDVSRIDSLSGTADFNNDFATDSGSAAAVFQISVVDLGGGLLVGSGSFTFTDDDGDTLSGDFGNGIWRQFGSFVTFDGEITTATFTDNGQTDGEFNGTTVGTSFTFTDLQNLTGFSSVLFRRSSGFTTDFANVSAQADGLLIPAPATVALAGLGGLIAAGRRRK